MGFIGKHDLKLAGVDATFEVKSIGGLRLSPVLPGSPSMHVSYFASFRQHRTALSRMEDPAEDGTF